MRRRVPAGTALLSLAVAAGRDADPSQPAAVVSVTEDGAAPDEAAPRVIARTAAEARRRPGPVRVPGSVTPPPERRRVHRARSDARARDVADGSRAAVAAAGRIRVGPRGAVPFEVILAESAGHEAVRGAYVPDGEMEVAGDRVAPGRVLVFRAGPRGARVLLLGGAAMDGPRHPFWAVVSSSRDRIERANADRQAGRSGEVPGDERESSPSPERGSVRAESRPPEPGRVGEGSPTSGPVARPLRPPPPDGVAARSPARTPRANEGKGAGCGAA